MVRLKSQVLPHLCGQWLQGLFRFQNLCCDLPHVCDTQELV